MMNADEKIDQLIREIAIKHGIAVARDDPILVLQTINHRLLQDSVAAQQAMLDRYKEELEGISNRWGMDAQQKAERVLNSALDASRKAMALMVQSASKEASATIEEKFTSVVRNLDSVGARTYRAAFLNVCASFLTVAGVIIMLVFL